MKAGLAAAAATALAAPVVAVLAVLGAAGTALACFTAPGPALAAGAPVPAPARVWIAAVQNACPQLPQPWIAAVMAADSGFDPAHAGPRGRGLIAVTDADWVAVHGAGWNADLDGDGLPDDSDPLTVADVAGQMLCQLLDDLDQPLGTPLSGARRLSWLDTLALAHHSGPGVVATYPRIDDSAKTYLEGVHADAVAWTSTTPTATAAGSATGAPSQVAPSALVDAACASSLADTGTVVVPPGTPTDVAGAVAAALNLVGARSGWYNRCDRLACRAYGYANSGYESASVHWTRMLATGHARPGDRCPPLGAFVYWATGSPAGHVALVVQADPGCDPARIKVVTNDALDHATGFTGGVYLVTLAQIETGFMSRSGYRGWSDPVCAGALQVGAA
ncbi:hypothetical protein [Pseudonocardia sp.]|uniref:hypothetical protein n=1 Tax=Pseudonocardia sp. TaxID=60912 RepID=UPI003D1228E0